MEKVKPGRLGPESPRVRCPGSQVKKLFQGRECNGLWHMLIVCSDVEVSMVILMSSCVEW